jgi:hypothetical protein
MATHLVDDDRNKSRTHSYGERGYSWTSGPNNSKEVIDKVLVAPRATLHRSV